VKLLFAIGADKWPGLSKLVEEAGEVLQVCGKLMGTFGSSDHWDGSDLKERLEQELGDLLAAIDFVLEANKEVLNSVRIGERRREKLKLFRDWHKGFVKTEDVPRL
jgi:NTP pyrophosphatase (non-canonical NTP hydrolase)